MLSRSCGKSINSVSVTITVATIISGLLLFFSFFASPVHAQSTAQRVRQLYNQARVEILDEDLEEALITLDKALKMDPHDGRIISLKAKTLELLQRVDDAIAFYESLIAKDPKAYGHLHFEVAYLCRKADQNERALEHFQAAEKLDLVRALREEGAVLSAMKRYDEAIQTFGRLETEEPGLRQEFAYLSAQAYSLKRAYKKALVLLDEALAIDPNSKMAQNIISLQENLKVAMKADRPWQVYITGLVQYDDNVFLNPLEDDPAQQGATNKADGSFLAGIKASYRLARRQRTSFGLEAQVQSLNYFRLTDSNFSFWSTGLYAGQQGDGWGLRVPYTLSYFYAKADLEARLIAHTLSPSLGWQMNPRFRTEVNGVFQHRAYFDGSPLVNHWGIGLTHIYNFNDPTKTIRLGYRFDSDHAFDEESGYRNIEVSLGGGSPIYGPFSFDVAVTYAHYYYDPRPALYGQTLPDIPKGLFHRHDDQFRVAAQLIYRPSARIQLVFGYFLTINDSNVNDGSGFDPYRFVKNTTMLLVSIGL